MDCSMKSFWPDAVPKPTAQAWVQRKKVPYLPGAPPLLLFRKAIFSRQKSNFNCCVSVWARLANNPWNFQQPVQLPWPWWRLIKSSGSKKNVYSPFDVLPAATTTRGQGCSLFMATPTTFSRKEPMQLTRQAPQMLGPPDWPLRRTTSAFVVVVFVEAWCLELTRRSP